MNIPELIKLDFGAAFSQSTWSCKMSDYRSSWFSFVLIRCSHLSSASSSMIQSRFFFTVPLLVHASKKEWLELLIPLVNVFHCQQSTNYLVQNSTQTLDVQLAYAENSTLMFSPGEGYPSETTTPATSPSSSSAPANSPITLSSGAIAGIVIGGIAMIVLIVVLCLKWRRKEKRASNSQNAQQQPPSYSSPLQHLPPFPELYSPPNRSPESHYNGFPPGSPDPNQLSPR